MHINGKSENTNNILAKVGLISFKLKIMLEAWFVYRKLTLTKLVKW